MSGMIVLIAGLPGSGKTTYGRRLEREIGATGYIDDYHRESVNNSSSLENGRMYRPLIEGLRRGQKWIASDIDWCRTKKRRQIEDALLAQAPGTQIEWHFVVADPKICRDRVVRRGREGVDFELRKIDELYAQFTIPAGARVVRSATSQLEP